MPGRSHLMGVLSVSCLLLLGGCGSSREAAPELVPVTGTVTLNGEPLGGASVMFVPRGNTKGAGGFAGTNPDGTYEMLHISGGKGVEPGEYVVTFSKMAMPDGSPIPAGKNATDVGARESLPVTLVRPEMDRASYIATVSAGTPRIDFDVKTKKGK